MRHAKAKFLLRRSIAILLALLVCICALPAMAEQPASQTLQGLLTEVGDGYFLMQDETLGTVQVLLDDVTTVYDGVAAKGKLTVGLYVFVQYNGQLSPGDPPKVTAQKVGCYVVNGTVGEILQNGYLVTEDSVLGDVLVHMGQAMPSVYTGMTITVYYNGVMALSMPPQITAAYILVPMLDGYASAVTDQGFTVTDADGAAYPIAVSTATRMLTVPAEGAHVRVYFLAQPQANAANNALEVTALSDDGTPAEVFQY